MELEEAIDIVLRYAMTAVAIGTLDLSVDALERDMRNQTITTGEIIAMAEIILIKES